MKKRDSVFLILILLTLGILMGCGGGRQVTKVKTMVPPVSSQPYTLGPMDKIVVKVFLFSYPVGHPGDTPGYFDTYTIDCRGMIRFALLGDVNCLGLTTYELADLLEEEFSRYLKNPQVRVEVVEYNSQKVIIMGAVGSPGIYFVKSRLTVMEAIALAGGFREGAKSTQVFIGRGELGNLQLLKVNVKNIMVRGRKDQNILLQNGDIVFVPTTFIANVNKAIQQISPSLSMYNTLETFGDGD